MMKKILAPMAGAVLMAALAMPALAAEHVRHMHVKLPNGQTWNNVTDRPGHPWSSDSRVRHYLHGRKAHLVYDRKHDLYHVVLNSAAHTTTGHVYHGYHHAHYAHHQPVHHRHPMHHAVVRKTTTVRTTTTTTVTPAMGQ